MWFSLPVCVSTYASPFVFRLVPLSCADRAGGEHLDLLCKRNQGLGSFVFSRAERAEQLEVVFFLLIYLGSRFARHFQIASPGSRRPCSWGDLLGTRLATCHLKVARYT